MPNKITSLLQDRNMIYAISKTTRYGFDYAYYAFHKCFIKLLKKNLLIEKLGLQEIFCAGTIE